MGGLTGPEREFSRFAHTYSRTNTLQREIVRTLLGEIGTKPRKILDLGAGHGEVASHIGWDYETLVAVDIAQTMCDLHPRSDKISVVRADFDDAPSVAPVFCRPYDLVVSASALQWSADLSMLLENISRIGSDVAFALFTAGTFRTLYDTAGLESPLPTLHAVVQSLEELFEGRWRIGRFERTFADTRAMLRYIKHSGFNGFGRKLDYRRTRRLIDEYPVPTLEFEVLYFWGRPHGGPAKVSVPG